ncbi:PAS domain S-box (fragment) [Candidatus Sulfopaludibacter sp. SbA3]
MNLVGNAVKFTTAGTVSVRAFREELAGALCLQFVVADSGPGIPADKQADVFGAFEQGDASMARRFGGTGLGLAIAAKLVGLMGGRIWVESPWRAPGSRSDTPGSAFHFTACFLPGMPAAAERRRFVAARSTGPLHVLVAEDNDVNRRLVQRLLEKQGHTVSAVADGRSAVDAVFAECPDLVLMDLQMPGMDGLEATRAIRVREAATGAHIPILALTDHAMSGDRDLCLSAGMDGYITKPIAPGELCSAVERAMAG